MLKIFLKADIVSYVAHYLPQHNHGTTHPLSYLDHGDHRRDCRRLAQRAVHQQSSGLEDICTRRQSYWIIAIRGQDMNMLGSRLRMNGWIHAPIVRTPACVQQEHSSCGCHGIVVQSAQSYVYVLFPCTKPRAQMILTCHDQRSG